MNYLLAFVAAGMAGVGRELRPQAAKTSVGHCWLLSDFRGYTHFYNEVVYKNVSLEYSNNYESSVLDFWDLGKFT